MVAVNENSTYAAHDGKSLGEIACAVNQDPWDVFTIRDRATFSQQDAISEGMKFVIVNGGIVIEDGK